MTEHSVAAPGLPYPEEAVIDLIKTVPLTSGTYDQTIDAFIDLAKLRDELDTRIKLIASAMDTLEPELVKAFTATGRQRETRRGRTVYLRRDLYPRVLAEGDAKEEFHRVLEENPHTGYLVAPTVNASKLRSWMLALEKDALGTPIIPEPLRPFLGVADVFRVKVS